MADYSLTLDATAEAELDWFLAFNGLPADKQAWLQGQVGQLIEDVLQQHRSADQQALTFAFNALPSYGLQVAATGVVGALLRSPEGQAIVAAYAEVPEADKGAFLHKLRDAATGRPPTTPAPPPRGTP